MGVRRGQPPSSGSFVAPDLQTYESIETMNVITDQANHTEGVASRTHTFHRIDVRVFWASCHRIQRYVHFFLSWDPPLPTSKHDAYSSSYRTG